MKSSLLIQIKKFLNQLESTQQRLWSLCIQRRKAIRTAQSDEILRLAEEEFQLTEELKSHLAMRQQILTQANAIHLPAGTIEELVQELGGDEKEQLNIRIERSKQLSEKIRTESWIHWIVAQRSINHCNEMMDIIANKGEASPTYHSENNSSSSGGVILDASI